jgi:hypothetical protein
VPYYDDLNTTILSVANLDKQTELMQLVPNLTQLWIGGNVKLERPQGPVPGNCWPNLRVLILGRDVKLGRGASEVFPMLPSSHNIRVLSLATEDRDLVTNILLGGIVRSYAEPSVLSDLGSELGTHIVYPWTNLESFKLGIPLADIATLEWVVKPSLLAGKLRTLDLTLGKPSDVSDDEDAMDIDDNPSASPTYDGYRTEPVRHMPFLCSNSLETIGLSEFRWGGRGGSSPLDPRPFLAWLDACPNVRRVRVNPGREPNTEALVEMCLRRPGMEAVYVPTRFGASVTRRETVVLDPRFNKVRELVETEGDGIAKLVETDNPWHPERWPVLFGR